jgi:hypothetical protein
MKKKRNNPQPKDEIQGKIENIPDDSIKIVDTGSEETPEIYKISVRGKTLDRKNFVKSAASAAGLAALGTLLNSCEESTLEITKSGEACSCHAVCACNTDWDEGDNYQKGDKYETRYDKNKHCTCDTVCTCNSVCTCDSVCGCNSEGGGGGGSYSYTYWYPC